MNPLRDWRPGDVVQDNEKHQQVVRALRDLDRRLRRLGESQSTRQVSLLVEIVTEGPEEEPDYPDERYWGRIVYLKGAKQSERVHPKPDGRINTPINDDDTPPPNILTFKNLAERNPQGNATGTGSLGCHLLDPGRLVWVRRVLDRGDPNRWHYVCNIDPSPVTVKVTSEATGIGMYNGKVIRRPTADVDPAADVSASTFGTEGADCIIANAAEIGGDGHWIAAGAVTFGSLRYVNSDGTPVIGVDTQQSELCDTSGGA